MAASSSSSSSEVVVWYALSWPSSPLEPDKDEIRRRGKRVELVLEQEMVDWEFKDLVRRENNLSAPLLLYEIDEKRGGRWTMCHNIDASRNPWFLKVEVGSTLPAAAIPILEEHLERQQWIMDSYNNIAYDNAAKHPPEDIKFQVFYAIAMPAHRLETLQAMESSRTRSYVAFPKVPTIGEFKAQMHKTEAHMVRKSWPIKYYDRLTHSWMKLPLPDLRDDVLLSDFGTSDGVDLVFECPKNMISYALPPGVQCEPWSRPPPDDRY